MARKGRCLCGNVEYEITSEVSKAGACHCNMCQRWSGGVYFAVEVPSDALRVMGEVSSYQSSAWAERCFCARCGTSLWYRLTAPGDHHGTYHLGFGTLSDKKGVAMEGEIFVDHKPDLYNLEGEHPRMTEAEFMATILPNAPG